MATPAALPLPLASPTPGLRDVLGEQAWRRLPMAVRQRFAVCLQPGIIGKAGFGAAGQCLPLLKEQERRADP